MTHKGRNEGSAFDAEGGGGEVVSLSVKRVQNLMGL